MSADTCDCGAPGARRGTPPEVICDRCRVLDGSGGVETLLVAELAVCGDLTLTELAALVGSSRRQALRRLHLLEERGRVSVCREQELERYETGGWQGRPSNKVSGYRYRLADPARRTA